MTIQPKKLKKSFEQNLPVIFFRAARLPESDRVFAGASDFKLYHYDLAAEKPAPQPFAESAHESYVMGLVFAGNTLISGSYDGKLIWWDTETAKPQRTVEAHSLWIRNLVVTPDGKRVISVADDMHVKVWDAETGELIHTLAGHEPITPNNYPSMLYATAVSRDGKFLATGDKAGVVLIWSLADGKQVGQLHAPVMYTWDPRARRHSIGGIRSLAFSADGKQIAAGGIGKIGNIDHLGGPSRIEIFDWRDGKRLHEIEDPKHKGLVEQLRFAEDDNWLLAVGGDHGGFVSFYNPGDGKVIQQEKAPMHGHDLLFDKAGERLHTVGHNKIATWTFA